MENEIDLIRGYQEKQVELDRINAELAYAPNEPKVVFKLQDLLMEIEVLKDKLSNVVDKSSTYRRKGNLINIIYGILSAIRPANGLRPSRNQGLILENAIYGEILADIKSSLNSDAGHTIPSYLYEAKSTFDPTKVEIILKQSLRSLNNVQINSYIDLERFVKELMSEIVQLSSEDIDRPSNENNIKEFDL